MVANHPSAAAKRKNGKNKSSIDDKKVIKEKVFTKKESNTLKNYI